MTGQIEIQKLLPKIEKIIEKKSYSNKKYIFKLFFCQDETTIGLNPSKDHTLLIPKSISKKRDFCAKQMHIWPKMGEILF